MERFALIGTAGYIAPRHLEAIKATDNDLVAALDPHDSVGVLDHYFPEAHYFREFERFDRHIDKLRRRNDGQNVNYISICSPNYLHDAHVRFALRSEAHAICEKPLAINPWNLDGLAEIEAESEYRVNCILQLRLHPSLIELKKRITESGRTNHEVDLTYITPRGRWYQASWKGDNNKSGGVASNIGVHFYDMLIWIFGSVESSEVHHRDAMRISGVLHLKKAKVRWYLSVDGADLDRIGREREPYRSIQVDGEELEFSKVFRDLHTESYSHILQNAGFGIEEARPSIELLHRIRQAPIQENPAERHPLLAKP